MSAWTYMESVGSSSASARPASTELDELTTTWAPASATWRATASPMPLVDPVTIATCPSNALIQGPLFGRSTCSRLGSIPSV